MGGEDLSMKWIDNDGKVQPKWKKMDKAEKRSGWMVSW